MTLVDVIAVTALIVIGLFYIIYVVLDDDLF